MIKRIFFDIDETLIHTEFSPIKGFEYKKFILDEDDDYYTVLREGAKEIVRYGFDLIGRENVYLLTYATKDYALKINEIFNFDVIPENIFSREDLDQYSSPFPYGGDVTYMHPLANENNVLIDDINYFLNERKTSFMNIRPENFLNTKAFYGANFPNYNFFEVVKNFLDERNK